MPVGIGMLLQLKVDSGLAARGIVAASCYIRVPVSKSVDPFGDAGAACLSGDGILLQHSCRICGSEETVVWKKNSVGRRLRPEDLRITDSGYGTTLGLLKCHRCGFIFAESNELDELHRLYEQLADPEYETTQDTRRLQMQWLLKLALETGPRNATLLDVGAGTGLLVREARDLGIDAAGIEPSRALVEFARTRNRVDLHQGVLPHPELTGRKFDLVLLVDVIEHVENPLQLLMDCSELLVEGGRLIVVTPDVRSIAARLFGQRWWHFRLAHVGYFSRKSLATAAAAAGLEATRWKRAKWFFRVEYLAERSASYLPIAWFNRLAKRVSPLRWCYNRVVPLNLHDSFVVVFKSLQ
ncbi:MAG: class I SAM-dependent methyltransferase [bacterium]|nr:class I SAM-dependent methyltransferase [bacterium]